MKWYCYQGRSPEVPVTPPFCKLFLTKQPTTGGENAMTIFLKTFLNQKHGVGSTWQSGEYPHFDTVWPLLWKILATHMTVTNKNSVVTKFEVPPGDELEPTLTEVQRLCFLVEGHHSNAYAKPASCVETLFDGGTCHVFFRLRSPGKHSIVSAVRIQSN